MVNLQQFLHSSSRQSPLRIGILVDSPALPLWAAETIRQIAATNYARIELVVFHQQDIEPTVTRSLFGRLWNVLSDTQSRRGVLYSFYGRMDRWRGNSRDATSIEDCSALLRDIDSICVRPITRRFVHRFREEDVAAVRAADLDVLLRFGFNILRGDILKAARYGVWSYHHGDNDSYRGGPAHFWEMVEENPISGVTLQVLTEDLDGGMVLCKGHFATRPGWSLVANRQQPYWGSQTYAVQKLWELHQFGWSFVSARCQPSAPYRGKRSLYVAPTNWEMTAWLVPLLAKKAVRRITARPAIKHWRLAIRRSARSIAESTSDPDLSDLRWIESPRGRFYADPFLLEHAGGTWVFFEDLDYATGRGRISCSEIRGDGIGPAIPVLERPYHLSYPNVFHHEGNVYMVPESSANNAIELYKCTKFPDQWQFEQQLFPLRGVDTSIWFEHGVFWFFTTFQEPRQLGMQLWLFWSESLTGKWHSHPANPLSTDVRNARGAGAIFRRNGVVYRPSQDCSRHYGYSFTLNRIDVLDKERYEETPSRCILPDWDASMVGTHSYSLADGFEVIDGCCLLPASRVL